MSSAAPARGSSLAVQGWVAIGGVAALSWEVLWQHHASLALGVSALGTAITLAATMAGMTTGSLLAGRLLRRRQPTHPARLYGRLELLIGCAGLLMPAGLGSWSGSTRRSGRWRPGSRRGCTRSGSASCWARPRLRWAPPSPSSS